MRNITLKQAAEWCGGTVAQEFAQIEFSGAQFDSRKVEAGELFVALVGERNGHTYARSAMERGAVAVLASEELPSDIPAVYTENTLSALQAIAKGYRESLPCKCIGVTGSVGKTTTKEMLAAVLQTHYNTQKTPKNFNNDIGLPVTVLGLERECETAVLEMGMNHFGEISLLTKIAQPDIALITNVGTMHIEHLGSREGILKAKLEILEGLRPNGTVVFCGDNDLLQSVAKEHKAICYGFGAHNDVRAVDVRCENGVSCFTVSAFGREIPIQLSAVGDHNILNALAAVTVGLLCDVPIERIQAGLRGFANTEMRQNIYTRDSLCIIEDCYNAGPESMQAALQVLSAQTGRKIAVLGGMLELGDFAPQAHFTVGQAVAKCADLLFAYGTHSEEYVRGAQTLSHAKAYETHEALVTELKALLCEGDCLLVKGSRGMRMERVLQLLFN